MERSRYDADQVQDEQSRLDEDVVHRAPQLFMGNVAERQLNTGFVYVPDDVHERDDTCYPLEQVTPVARILKAPVIRLGLVGDIQTEHAVVNQRQVDQPPLEQPEKRKIIDQLDAGC